MVSTQGRGEKESLNKEKGKGMEGERLPQTGKSAGQWAPEKPISPPHTLRASVGRLGGEWLPI